MIKIKNMYAGYGKKDVLRDIRLDIAENEVVAVVGQSGCGKSTLLKTINRMIEEERGYYRGTVEYGGKDIRTMSKEALRKTIGMVFQEPIAFPVSIYDNITYVLKYHGMRDKRALDATITHLLERVGLYDEVAEKLDDKADHLSGGQKQRLAIARCLSAEPEVILLDEPCSALDLKNTVAIEEMLLELRGAYTLVIVTHNLAQARRIADRIVLMDRGEIVEVADKERFFTNPKSALAEELIRYMS
ncbi:MAG: ATP-binding cassette domain-containing protein [Peptoniphilus sp.]|nr:ATP-binding cassette domain-containing protein [Peptoniphilus sp.]MDD7362663.1 ATP-binding cassette domain-containing protein [Bacillota bacterium]MDY6044938.1 ATP-binding cassette domain-containing protein [Peptoniphilus sp.]